MTPAERQEGDDISLLALGTTLLKNRWRIARWMLIGAVAAALVAFLRPPLYLASATFFPQGQSDASRSGLASIAGQLGVAMSTGNQSLSPDFYAQLLESRELLTRIARDTLVVQEMGQKRVAFLDLFGIKGSIEGQSEEHAVKVLTNIIDESVGKTTGVVEFSVITRWPSVSVAIAGELLSGVDEFNRRMRQEQAGLERKFVEGRLAIAGADLRSAEDRLEAFLKTNRQFASSPDLTFQRDRLQRDLSLKQDVFTSFTQSYNDVRIREVRDTPVITVIESPSVPTLPEPRHRLALVLLGAILGGFVGAVGAVTSEVVARRRREESPEAREFDGTLGEVKDEIRSGVRWFGNRSRG